MVSVAFYFGFIDLQSFKNRFNISFKEYFKEEVQFLLNEKLIEILEDRIFLTERGADYINGIIPLFYSDRSKRELIDLDSKSNQLADGEAQFLKAYNIGHYAKPSVAADIVLFVVPRLADAKEFIAANQFSIVLIKRGEHPYMNSWALPGGFVRQDEAIEDTAVRELHEETGLENIPLIQHKLFSEQKRDPRGWIISSSFIGFVEERSISLSFGEDAIESALFKVSISRSQGLTTLTLVNGGHSLVATLSRKESVSGISSELVYEIVESAGLAFDHAKIILSAVETILL
jgi:oxygen-independent coproporphyrinogen-3 oxidase